MGTVLFAGADGQHGKDARLRGFFNIHPRQKRQITCAAQTVHLCTFSVTWGAICLSNSAVLGA